MGETEYSIHDFSIILEDSKVLSLPWTIQQVQEDYNVLQTKKLWKYLDKILETFVVLGFGGLPKELRVEIKERKKDIPPIFLNVNG